MLLARDMRVIVLAATLVGASSLSASASTSHYFYDAAGRYIGQTSTGTQVRSNVYDNADNRQSYQVLVPTSPTSSQALGQNQSMFQGQTLVSGNGVYTLGLQEDGNLVIYDGTNGIWSTNTGNTTGATLIMQGDGNLVLYDAQWRGIWATNTGGNPGATVTMQTDGNLVIYSSSGQPLWGSGTAGR